MSRRVSTEATRQRGDALLEAMVGMIIVGLVSAASVFALGRGVKLQYSANARAQAVEQLRALMLSNNGGAGLCAAAAPGITIDGVSYAVTVNKAAPYCQPYQLSLTLPGATAPTAASASAPVSATPLQLSVTAPSLGGTLTVSSN